MPVKVGGSYVSEAAYSYAKAQMDEGNVDSSVMKSLSEKFSKLKFSTGTKPFSGTGTNNVSISPKILKQMEKDPEKRLEYEALIYDISNTDLAQGRNPKSAGWIIGDDGGLSAWSVSGQDTRNQSSVKRTGARNWWRELLQNYDIVKRGMTKISSKYLRDCVQDEDKLQSLFENLSAADSVLKERQGEIGFQGMKVTIDENGEVTMESSKSTIGFNGEKIRRQMAAAATQGDMKAVLALLEQDIQELEDGLKQNMCDAAEVEKAKELLEEAKQRMASLPNRAPTPAEQSRMSVNLLI